MATSLGLPDSAAQPLSSSTPVSSTAGADLVLVVGPDLATKVPATTTTAAASSSHGASAASTTSSATTTTTATPTATAHG